MKVPIEHTEEELLQKLSAGDETAFRAVYELYRKRIASFAFLMTESKDMTDEIVQEVFVKLWKNRVKLNEVNQFSAWIHAITRNLVIDAMKKRSRERKLQSDLLAMIPADENYIDSKIIFLIS